MQALYLFTFAIQFDFLNKGELMVFITARFIPTFTPN